MSRTYKFGYSFIINSSFPFSAHASNQPWMFSTILFWNIFSSSIPDFISSAKNYSITAFCRSTSVAPNLHQPNNRPLLIMWSSFPNIPWHLRLFLEIMLHSTNYWLFLRSFIAFTFLFYGIWNVPRLQSWTENYIVPTAMHWNISVSKSF